MRWQAEQLTVGVRCMDDASNQLCLTNGRPLRVDQRVVERLGENIFVLGLVPPLVAAGVLRAICGN
jgi:hypothetical protein